MSNSPDQFSIGSIVVLTSHPFTETKDKDYILLNGDYMSLSPIMVVVETVKENKTLYDENTGEQLLISGSYQCKCLWYSSKSSSFEEAWITSRLLRVLEQNTTISQTLPFGSSVYFKTAPIEIGKKKVSLKQIGTLLNDKNKSLTGLLTFTSPVMQVIGTAKSDCKEPLIDPKTGTIKRIISKQLIKCKYYNSSSEKFSEVLIPIEALTSIVKIEAHHLTKLRDWISNMALLKTGSTSHSLKKTIIKPLSINFKLGNYYLEAKDYLLNKVVEILIEGSDMQFEQIDTEIYKLPMFEATGKHLSIKPIRHDTLAALPYEKLWRIKYKDANNNVTTRTIYNPSIYHSEEVNSNNEETNIIYYLKASCLNSNHEERYFRIDRIQILKVFEIDVSEAIRKQ